MIWDLGDRYSWCWRGVCIWGWHGRLQLLLLILRLFSVNVVPCVSLVIIIESTTGWSLCPSEIVSLTVTSALVETLVKSSLLVVKPVWLGDLV